MFVLHKPENCAELKANKDKCWPGWKLVHTIPWQTPGTNKVDLDIVATKIVHNAQLQTSNYWSLLACLVKEQEEHAQENHTKQEMAMLAIADGQLTNNVAAHWAQKLANRKLGSNIRSGPRGRWTRPQQHRKNIQENIHVPQRMHQKGNQENASQA